jgi:NAD(P)H dehydrogenase (quinone)
VIVPPGYTDRSFSAAGGNPYGTAHASGDGPPGDEIVAAARQQGRRLVRVGEALKTLQSQSPERLAA